MAETAIEQRVKGWIGTATAAGTRVSVGSRVQATALPAIVVEVDAGEPYCFPTGTLQFCDRWTVRVRCIAETALSAHTLYQAAATALLANVPATDGCALEIDRRTIEEPVLGEGDESQPAICTATFQIYYRS